MRHLFVFPLILAAAACAAPSQDPSAADDVSETDALTKVHDDLSAKDSKLVLTLLDDVCGDTWCEGDYDWRFEKLSCDFGKKSCTLTVRITDPGKDDGPKDDKTYWRSCKIANAGSKMSDLVDTAKNGYQSLNDRFYDRVDACITKLENGVPR